MSEEQATIQLADVMVDGSGYLMSLGKLTGLKVVDVQGYIGASLGDPLFRITHIAFEDGSSIRVEGAHDMAYVTYNDKLKNLDESTIVELFEQSGG